MFKRFLGVDLSLRNAGVALIMEDKHIQFVKSIKSKSGEVEHTTIDSGVATLFDLLYEYGVRDYSDLLVVIEDYAFSKNQGKHFGRAEYVGVVTHSLRFEGASVIAVNPQNLKSYTTGNHKADKSDMVAHINAACGLDLKDDNQADALALAIYGHAIFVNGERQLTRRARSLMRG